MSGEKQELTKDIQEELKWLKIKEDSQDLSFQEKLQAKGLSGVLVPIGCLFTAGILANGLLSLVKGDSRKQQILMRYRVLAQSITLAIATLGILNFKS